MVTVKYLQAIVDKPEGIGSITTDIMEGEMNDTNNPLVNAAQTDDLSAVQANKILSTRSVEIPPSKLKPGSQKKKSPGGGRWSEKEDDLLRKAVEETGARNWKRISGHYFNGKRSDVQCLHRWQKVLRPGLVKGAWTKEEDETVTNCRNQGILKWSEIAAHIPGRIGKQCRERWFNHLAPDINKNPWTEEEDKLLVEAQAKYGNKWSTIAKLIPGRAENAVKNRWNSSMRRKNALARAEKGNNSKPPNGPSSKVKVELNGEGNAVKTESKQSKKRTRGRPRKKKKSGETDDEEAANVMTYMATGMPAMNKSVDRDIETASKNLTNLFAIRDGEEVSVEGSENNLNAETFNKERKDEGGSNLPQPTPLLHSTRVPLQDTGVETQSSTSASNEVSPLNENNNSKRKSSMDLDSANKRRSIDFQQV